MAQRLIDANELLRFINSISTSPLDGWDTGGVINTVERQPTVDAKPVAHGEWEEHRYGTTLDPSCVEYSCSVCGKFVDDYMPNFCPNCGAEMRGEK